MNQFDDCLHEPEFRITHRQRMLFGTFFEFACHRILSFRIKMYIFDESEITAHSLER